VTEKERVPVPKRTYIGTENRIGQNVVRIRKAQHINQSMLLARVQVRGMDMSQIALSAIEGQKRPVSDREMRIIADALGVTVEELYAPEGPKE